LMKRHVGDSHFLAVHHGNVRYCRQILRKLTVLISFAYTYVG